MKNVVGTGVLLKTTNGTYLFQERDGNTDKNPNMIAPFGGGRKDGESLVQCAVRELKEELCLDIPEDTLREVGVCKSRNNSEKYIMMYHTEIKDTSTLKLQEGRAIIECTIDEALHHEKVTSFTKEVLKSIQN